MSLKGIVAGFLAIILALTLMYAAFWAPIIVPPKLWPDAYSDRDLKKEDTEKIRLQLEIRKSVLDWLQIVFNAATAAGLIGTLFYTARSYRVASENLRVTEYSKFSEAYLKSVEQLGSKDQSTVVGTIHALGRLALSSRNDHYHVMTILCDYVRRKAPHRVDASGQPGIPGEIQPEIQAVLNVLRTRKADWENKQNPINLSATCLYGGFLQGVNFKYAILEDCELRSLNLRRANLQKAKLSRALLNDAPLDGADLRGANLQNTDLDGARLVSVQLNHTNLEGAHGSVVGTHTRRSHLQEEEPGLEWI